MYIISHHLVALQRVVVWWPLLLSATWLPIAMASCTTHSPAPEESDSSFSVLIIARLTVHAASQGINKGNNRKKATKKETKTKEFMHTFSATKANYLELLTALLTKHHIGNRLQVTDRRRYTCKMQVPPSKYVWSLLCSGYNKCWPFHPSKGDACDVENYSEYEDVVKKVLEKRPTKAITVYLDMKDVNWICDMYTLPLQKDTSRDSEDESNDEEQSDDVSSLSDQRNNGWASCYFRKRVGLQKLIRNWPVSVACWKKSTQMIMTLATHTSTLFLLSQSHSLHLWWRNGLALW